MAEEEKINENLEQEKEPNLERIERNYPLNFSTDELNEELEKQEQFYGMADPRMDEEDLEELKGAVPKPSRFPYGILMMAVFKDFVDIATLGIGGSLLNIVCGIAISCYLWGKVGFVKRMLYRRYIFYYILEFVPFVNFIPATTIFVIRGYMLEKKKINQVITAVENLILKFSTGKLDAKI